MYSKEERTRFFKEELEFINDLNKRKFAEEFLWQVPDYFFDIPASSTGKYHPDYAARNHGLVLHTRAAMHFLRYMTEIEQCEFTEEEKDLLMIAVLVHDTFKKGAVEEKYTAFDHPLLAAKAVRNYIGETSLMTKEDLEFIADAVSSHMGQWTKDYKGKEVLPKPTTPAQKIVHLADYLASRKQVEFIFYEDWARPSVEMEAEKSADTAARKNFYLKDGLDRSKKAYADLYASGKSFDEIADIYGVKRMTAENNVLEAIPDRTDIDINQFIDNVYESQIKDMLSDPDWDGKLKSIKEKLPETVSYLCIKAVKIKYGL